MATTNTAHFSIRVTPAEKAKIKRLAAQRGTSAKAAVLAVVEEALKPEKEAVAETGTLYDKIKHIFDERVSGLPSDLSTNPKYMEGFGQD